MQVLSNASTASGTSNQPRYRTSAVARMTDIPVASLRVWERRYQVVGPSRADSGHRLYSHDDVRRLLMIKRLVDLGNPIGSLASLNVLELQRMLEQADDLEAAGHGAPLNNGLRAVRTVILGEGLAAWARQRQAWPEHLDFVSAVDLTSGALMAAENRVRQLRADMLVVELHGLHPDASQMVLRCSRYLGARHVVVVYGFGPSADVDAMQARGWTVRRAPLSPVEIDALLAEGVKALASRTSTVVAPLATVPARRFDALQLAQVVEALPKVNCECPSHLASLITMLSQFEEYSAQCEIRHPDDVALHEYLHRVAATGRALFEEALVRVATVEGVPLPDQSS